MTWAMETEAGSTPASVAVVFMIASRSVSLREGVSSGPTRLMLAAKVCLGAPTAATAGGLATACPPPSPTNGAFETQPACPRGVSLRSSSSSSPEGHNRSQRTFHPLERNTCFLFGYSPPPLGACKPGLGEPLPRGIRPFLLFLPTFDTFFYSFLLIPFLFLPSYFPASSGPCNRLSAGGGEPLSWALSSLKTA